MESCIIPVSGLTSWKSVTPQCLQVLAGIAWVTQSGDHRDHVLHAGEQLTLRPGVCVAIQALDRRPVVYQVEALAHSACA